MTINIHIHHRADADTTEKLNLIIKNQKSIMATIAELQDQVTGLNTKVDELQASVDLEQQQIAELLATNAQVVTDLNTRIAELQAIIDAGAGATAEQLQTLSDGIKTATDKLDTSKADLEGTV